MWQQYNDINSNTLHPRRAAEVIAIKVQLQLLYKKGKFSFLSQERLLFSKMEANLLKGSPFEMLQWNTLVLNAIRHAASAKNDLEASI
jgi:hypothetical protein